MKNTMIEMIEAVRRDSKVGRGTCSSIDECFSDKELEVFLMDHKCDTVRGAVKAARWSEGLWEERAAEIRAEVF